MPVEIDESKKISNEYGWVNLRGTSIAIHFPQYDLGKLTAAEAEQLISDVEAKVSEAKDKWGATGVASVDGVLPHIDRLNIG